MISYTSQSDSTTRVFFIFFLLFLLIPSIRIIIYLFIHQAIHQSLANSTGSTKCTFCERECVIVPNPSITGNNGHCVL